MYKKIINSSTPSLCEFDEFTTILKDSWSSGILTHNGPLLQNLESQICKSLNINEYIAVANGTLALQLAIEALDIKGTILVPAFSWIATSAAVSWQKCKIKFCDINPKTLNICSESIKANLDSSVEAIMPVHVFGNPCDVKSIENIASKNNLKVIYDSAHAFGSTLNGKSILDFGDISCVSTHATKIFNTAEGGGLISNSKILNKKIKSLRFFGFDENKNVINDGINAKMTELHAALGLANLKEFEKTINHRREINDIYRNQLCHLKNIAFQEIDKGSNCSYFPIILEDELSCINLIKLLSEHNIFARRYLYPSLNKIQTKISDQECPFSESISSRILCLPCDNNVKIKDALYIASIISKVS